MKGDCDLEPSKRSRSTNFEESRKNLLKYACARLDTQRKHQQLLKESSKSNEDVGKEILSHLRDVCQQQEIDKVKLFTEEVDKITSLIIGLSSRLAKVNAASAKNTHPDEKLQVTFILPANLAALQWGLNDHFLATWGWAKGQVGGTTGRGSETEAVNFPARGRGLQHSQKIHGSQNCRVVWWIHQRKDPTHSWESSTRGNVENWGGDSEKP